MLLEPTKKSGFEGWDEKELVLTLSTVGGGSTNCSKSSWMPQPRLEIPIPAYPETPIALPFITSLPGLGKTLAPTVAPPNPRWAPFLLPRPTPGETHVGTGVDSDPAQPLGGQSDSAQRYSYSLSLGSPSSQLKNSIPWVRKTDKEVAKNWHDECDRLID